MQRINVYIDSSGSTTRGEYYSDRAYLLECLEKLHPEKFDVKYFQFSNSVEQIDPTDYEPQRLGSDMGIVAEHARHSNADENLVFTDAMMYIEAPHPDQKITFLVSEDDTFAPDDVDVIHMTDREAFAQEFNTRFL